MNEKTSRVHGFYKKTHRQRLEVIKKFSVLSREDFSLLKNLARLDFEAANRMIENVVSVMPLPLGIAPHFLVNGKEYLVPMAIEEASVVAAAAYAAKLARVKGGVEVVVTKPIMIGQIQLKKIPDLKKAKEAIEKHKQELLAKANSADPVLIEHGGGAKNIVCRPFITGRGDMLVIHLLVDVCDAMGANIVNIMGERITSDLKKLTGGIAGVRIVSNLSVHRMVHAKATWARDLISEKTIEGILDIYELACVDPFRCATHNKGIMNGIDAVAIATGNDFRAIEAGAHTFAVLGNCVIEETTDGKFSWSNNVSSKINPLSQYYKNRDGDLVGELRIPLAVGIVGGITQCHPVTKLCLKILQVTSANELAGVMGAVGLVQNFAALRALACEGISKGHMCLHSKNIAIAAGASKEFVDAIAQQMIDEDTISVACARKLLKRMKKK